MVSDLLKQGSYGIVVCNGFLARGVQCVGCLAGLTHILGLLGYDGAMAADGTYQLQVVGIEFLCLLGREDAVHLVYVADEGLLVPVCCGQYVVEA